MKELSLKLKIWRQKNQDDEGRFIEYDINGLNEHMSFLEMLDVLNERLISKGEEPIAFLIMIVERVSVVVVQW